MITDDKSLDLCPRRHAIQWMRASLFTPTQCNVKYQGNSGLFEKIVHCLFYTAIEDSKIRHRCIKCQYFGTFCRKGKVRVLKWVMHERLLVGMVAKLISSGADGIFIRPSILSRPILLATVSSQSTAYYK